MKYVTPTSLAAAAAAAAAFILMSALNTRGHEGTAFGEPGDPNKPARTIRVIMREDE